MVLVTVQGCGIGGSRGLVVNVLDSKFEGCEFKTNTVWKVPVMD